MSNLSVYAAVCSTLSPHGSGRHYYLLCIQNLKGSSWNSAPLGPGPPNNNLSPTHKKSTSKKKSKNKTSAYASTLRQIDIEGFSQAIGNPPCQCPYCTLWWLGASRGCAQNNQWGISRPKCRGTERRRGVDEIRYLSVDFAQTAFIPGQPRFSTSKPHQHMPDRHHLQNSNLKEQRFICVYASATCVFCNAVLPYAPCDPAFRT